MNFMVDPESHEIRALLDWEGAFIGVPDVDWHSPLRDWWWRWLSDDDARMAREALEAKGQALPPGYPERLPWFALDDLARRMGSYHEILAPGEGLVRYEKRLFDELEQGLP